MIETFVSKKQKNSSEDLPGTKDLGTAENPPARNFPFGKMKRRESNKNRECQSLSSPRFSKLRAVGKGSPRGVRPLISELKIAHTVMTGIKYLYPHF